MTCGAHVRQAVDMSMTTSLDEARRAALVRHVELAGVDQDAAHELYADDAVLEFPQSGERFDGLANFRAWRDQYPDPVALEVRRVTGTADVWVVEAAISYDGAPWKPAVSIYEFRDGKIVSERIYTTEPWPAPAWRAQWRTTTSADPAAPVA
jgi:ketosteroid isomerase-like protein